MKRISSLTCLFLALGLSTAAFPADPPTEASAKAPTAEQKAEWMKLTAPNENHKALNDIVGKWSYTSKMWMAPDSKAEETKGASTSKWILGGRFVQQDVKGKFMGQKFEGVGFTGFDNVKQEYQSVWMDSMSTAMMVSNGTKDASTGALTESGTSSCPMTGDKAKWFRTELKVENKNAHVFSMYSKTADGKEFKAMEITYKRSR